jgi:hypothetical protein
MTGMLGYGACYQATHEADLLLLLGTDFPYDAFLPQARTVQIDHDSTRLGRRTPLELAVHGDVAATLRAVLPLVEQRSDRSFLDRMLREHAWALERVVEAYTHDVEHRVPIHPEYAAILLDEVADDDAVFTVDTGMCNVWAARYITPNGRRRVIGSFLHGTMANALPHAIGAQLAYPRRQVISMSGGRDPRTPSRAAGGRPIRPPRGAEPPRPRPGRPRHRPQCDVDPAARHRRADQGLRGRGQQDRSHRRCGKNARAGAIQRSQHPPAVHRALTPRAG